MLARVDKFVILFLIFISGNCLSSFAQNVTACQKTFMETKVCPAAICVERCVKVFSSEPCIPVCQPKSCQEISTAECPLDFCRVMTSCVNERVCMPKDISGASTCGDLAYFGDELNCCDGLVKGCGVEFFDGTCDMEGKGSNSNFPMCIPCGNGICNQFENRCNCPEDCGKSNTLVPNSNVVAP